MDTPSCLLSAWSAHEGELRGYLRHWMRNADDAEDLLQEVFLKALRQGGRFCDIENARAWLFQVARNALADRLRVAREQVPLPSDDELAMPTGDNEKEPGASCAGNASSASLGGDAVLIALLAGALLAGTYRVHRRRG